MVKENGSGGTFRRIVEGTSGGILIAEFETQRFRYANQALCDLLGYESDELLQLRVPDIHPPDELSWIRAEFEAQSRRERDLLPDVPCLRKDGQVIHVDISSTPAEIDGVLCNIGFFIDRNVHRGVTALREREQELSEANKLLEAVLDAIPDIIGVQGPGHRVLRYNLAGYALLGTTPETLKGKRCYELIGKRRPCTECATQIAYDTKQVAQLERYEPTLDRWLDCRAYPVLDDEGRIYRVVEHLRDITERHRLEERLRQAEKMEAIGQLAGGVAHDFNNQLAGILGLAELLELELESRPDCRELVQEIAAAVERSANLTSQLLAFARRGKVNLTRVDLHGLVRDVIQLLRRSIDKRIAIRHQLDSDAAFTQGDATQLQNALLNLALNARDAMPDGGELLFESGEVTLDPAADDPALAELVPGSYAFVRVTDTGVGMDEETQRRIFEPFYTTKPRGKGTGMGLAAVYGTMQSHHGAIEVTSQPGQGTSFRLLLPLHTDRRPPTPPEEQPRIRPRRTATILVVDDEPVILRIARSMLERLGHRVLGARDGQEAVALYRERWQDINLVILDMQMPKMAGRETFEAMLRINPALRALLASGFSLDQDAQALLKQGVHAFLQKPFRMADLDRAVEAALRSDKEREGRPNARGSAAPEG